MPWDQNAFLNAVAAKSAMQRDQGAASLMQGRAAVTGADAQAHLHNAQAEWTGPKTQSEIGLNTAQRGYYGSLSNEAQQRANVIPGNATAQQHLWNSEGSFNEARTPQARSGSQWLTAPDTSVQTPPVSPTPPIGGMTPPSTDDTGPTGLGDLIRRHLGLDFAEGTSHISAPGDGTVDTTKANLANGEAVLNKGAAEHLGQPAIRALNAIGAARMGMVPGAGARDPQVEQANAAQTAGKPGHYAKGTSKAGPKGKGKAAKADAKDSKPDSKEGGKPAAQAQPSSSDTPSLDQIDPKMLAAAMQMGALGQQGAQPEPQPQPQPGQTPMGMM